MDFVEKTTMGTKPNQPKVLQFYEFVLYLDHLNLINCIFPYRVSRKHRKNEENLKQKLFCKFLF